MNQNSSTLLTVDDSKNLADDSNSKNLVDDSRNQGDDLNEAYGVSQSIETNLIKHDLKQKQHQHLTKRAILENESENLSPNSQLNKWRSSSESSEENREASRLSNLRSHTLPPPSTLMLPTTTTTATTFNSTDINANTCATNTTPSSTSFDSSDFALFIKNRTIQLLGENLEEKLEYYTNLVPSNQLVEKRLHVHNIPFFYEAEHLIEMFKDYGKILQVEVIKDKSGKSKGYGFITLADARQADAAKVELGGKYRDGRKIIINDALPMKYQSKDQYRLQ